MKNIDWSQAPEWAESVAKIGGTGGMFWVNGRGYVSTKEHGFHVFGMAYNHNKHQVCIIESRPTTPTWSGEGLPPVGIVCLFEYLEVGNWVEAKVIGYDGPACVVALDGYGYCGSPNKSDFCPLKSPRDRWVEAAERYAEGATNEPSNSNQLAALYDAMQSGTLPLPELEQ